MNGFADDYAFVIEALIEAHRQTLDAAWIQRAEQLMEHLIAHFSHDPTGLFYYTSDLDPPLIARKQELHDNVIPSSNASAAHSLLTLGTLLDRDDWRARSRKMLNCMIGPTLKHGESHGRWADLALRFAAHEPEIAIVGSQARELAQEWRSGYLPCQILTGAWLPQEDMPLTANRWIEGKTMIYVCRDSSCMPPTNDINQALLWASSPKT